jgi:hypothetical protein
MDLSSNSKLEKDSVLKKIMSFLQRHRVVLLIILSVALIVLRKPDNIFNAQFVAEDGKYWFADCYNMGIKCLLMPQDGYLQTVSRLGGLLSVLFPFRLAPAMLGFIALITQMLPVILLLSPRLKQLHPNFWVRAFLALLYIIIPNTGGTYLFLTCSQWYLALAAGLVVIFSAPSEKWKWFDRAVIFLAGLSGPFAPLLFPISLLKWLKTRRREDLIILGILLLTSLIQAYFVLSFKSVTPRFQGSIPWSLRAIFSALSIQLVWNLLISPNGYWWLHGAFRLWHTIAGLLSPLVFLMVAYTFIKVSYERKLYFLFAAAVAFVAILFPMGIDRSNLFYNLANNTEQLRYWLIPMTAVLASIVYCAAAFQPKIIKYTARGFLSLMVVGVIFSFRYPPTPDYHFADYARRFEQLQAGQKISIPMHPVPSYWIMQLTKH